MVIDGTSGAANKQRRLLHSRRIRGAPLTVFPKSVEFVARCSHNDRQLLRFMQLGMKPLSKSWSASINAPFQSGNGVSNNERPSLGITSVDPQSPQVSP